MFFLPPLDHFIQHTADGWGRQTVRTTLTIEKMDKIRRFTQLCVGNLTMRDIFTIVSTSVNIFAGLSAVQKLVHSSTISTDLVSIKAITD